MFIEGETTHVKQKLASAAALLGGVLAAAAVGQSCAQAKDKIPVDPKLLVEPPEGAVVLFGGKAEQLRDNWYSRRSTNPPGWTVDDKGVATPNHRDISSKKEFGDCYLHAEFREPLTGSGNSGVGMEGRYEIQILNSYGKQPESHECGGIYSEIPPKVIASKPVGQMADVRHLLPAPQIDAAGKLNEKARVTVYQNGILIHEDQEIPKPTGIQYEQYKGEVPKGPIVLQGDHDTVQFRNVWILPQSY